MEGYKTRSEHSMQIAHFGARMTMWAYHDPKKFPDFAKLMSEEKKGLTQGDADFIEELMAIDMAAKEENKKKRADNGI
jgi:hypothetical protein